MRPSTAALRLNRLALSSATPKAWRDAALDVLRKVVPFDGGIFHEMSPRSPIERAGLLGLTDDWLSASRDQWDEMAVTFGTLLHDATSHDWVALASRAFSKRNRLRADWNRRIAKPLNANDVAFVHLVVQGRVIAAVILTRTARLGNFDERAQQDLARLVAPLTVSDALQQAVRRTSSGLSVELKCVDGRLTARKRQIVEHVALGHTNAEIARALSISAHTVRNTLVGIQACLGASNRAEIVHRAVFS